VGAAAAAALGVVLAVSPVEQAPVSAQVAPIGTDTGTLRTDLFANGWNVARDSGYSASFTNAGGGQEAFWIFGDSQVFPPSGSPATDPYPTGDMPAWWRNNTSATGPFSAGAAPTGLQEVGTSGTAPVIPRQMIPDPAASGTDTVAGNGVVPCPAGSGLFPWGQGAARTAGSPNQIVVPYSTLCAGPSGTKVVATGFAQFNAATEQLVANTPDVFQSSDLPPYLQMQAPVFGWDHPYIYFSRTCVAPIFGTNPNCPATKTYLARMPYGWDPATGRPWLNPANFTWWNGTTWLAAGAPGMTDPVNDAASIVPSPGLSTNMVYQPSLGRYVLLEQLDFFGEQVRISVATTPAGPWTVKATGGSGCDRSGGTRPDGAQVRQCRGFILHAELGSANSVVFSFAQVKNTSPVFDQPTDNQVRLRKVTITLP
jgi:hypothetical protein